MTRDWTQRELGHIVRLSTEGRTGQPPQAPDLRGAGRRRRAFCGWQGACRGSRGNRTDETSTAWGWHRGRQPVARRLPAGLCPREVGQPHGDSDADAHSSTVRNGQTRDTAYMGVKCAPAQRILLQQPSGTKPKPAACAPPGRHVQNSRHEAPKARGVSAQLRRSHGRPGGCWLPGRGGVADARDVSWGDGDALG